MPLRGGDLPHEIKQYTATGSPASQFMGFGYDPNIAYPDRLLSLHMENGWCGNRAGGHVSGFMLMVNGVPMTGPGGFTSHGWRFAHKSKLVYTLGTTSNQSGATYEIYRNGSLVQGSLSFNVPTYTLDLEFGVGDIMGINLVISGQQVADGPMVQFGIRRWFE